MINLRFLDDYEDAVKYAKIQRRQTPPLYNPARAREQPIPIITKLQLVTIPYNNVLKQ